MPALIAPAASRPANAPRHDGGGVTGTLAVVHIVDDDEAFLNSTGRLLRAVGYRVELYGSADELLKRFPSAGRRQRSAPNARG
jgi:hypothetical protein